MYVCACTLGRVCHFMSCFLVCFIFSFLVCCSRLSVCCSSARRLASPQGWRRCFAHRLASPDGVGAHVVCYVCRLWYIVFVYQAISTQRDTHILYDMSVCLCMYVCLYVCMFVCMYMIAVSLDDSGIHSSGDDAHCPRCIVRR